MTGLLSGVPVKKVKQAKKAESQKQIYPQRAVTSLIRPTAGRQYPRGLLS